MWTQERERDRERWIEGIESSKMIGPVLWLCVCLCVFVHERERERDRERDREKEGNDRSEVIGHVLWRAWPCACVWRPQRQTDRRGRNN